TKVNRVNARALPRQPLLVVHLNRVTAAPAMNASTTLSANDIDNMIKLNESTYSDGGMPAMKLAEMERRDHRRHDVEPREINVTRWDGKRPARTLGKLVDLSAGGIRVRTDAATVKV